MKRFLIILLVNSGLFSYPSAVLALNTESERLKESVARKISNVKARNAAIERGHERALLCNYCHGEDGNSKKPDVPNLAGQNPIYLIEQIDRFARGQRKNFVMNSLAKEFSLEDKANLAVFYSSMPVRQVAYDRNLVLTGKNIYQGLCSNCHGERGIGEADYARIAGQQPRYVSMTLKRFRSNALNPSAGGQSGRRSQVMEQFAKNLSDTDIAALAAYIAQMR